MVCLVMWVPKEMQQESNGERELVLRNAHDDEERKLAGAVGMGREGKRAGLGSILLALNLLAAALLPSCAPSAYLGQGTQPAFT